MAQFERFDWGKIPIQCLHIAFWSSKYKIENLNKPFSRKFLYNHALFAEKQ